MITPDFSFSVLKKLSSTTNNLSGLSRKDLYAQFHYVKKIWMVNFSQCLRFKLILFYLTIAILKKMLILFQLLRLHTLLSWVQYIQVFCTHSNVEFREKSWKRSGNYFTFLKNDGTLDRIISRGRIIPTSALHLQFYITCNIQSFGFFQITNHVPYL